MTFQQMRHRFLVLITTIAFFFGSVSTALAASSYDYQNNQELNQSATLTAPSSDRAIQIYPQPDLKKTPLGKAQKGDRVTLLEKIQSDGGEQWGHVKFENEKQSEGWIQQDYIATQTQQSKQKEQKPAQQSQGQSSSAYSQQEDYVDAQQSSKDRDKQQQTYSQEKQNNQKAQSYSRN